MKILKTTDDFYLNIPQSVDFKTNAGWEENFASYENETMKKIINLRQSRAKQQKRMMRLGHAPE